MIYYVDIDEIICEYKGDREYPLATPIKKNIEKINKLYDEGHKVIYWTARGTVTGLDWHELTGNQLNEWGVKYHEYRLGKPHYDVFICDKAFNTEAFFKNE
tara:strand:- start:863 stop:1165 length:303 start_codon:yes stop_codon:yes gene_type:complete